MDTLFQPSSLLPSLLVWSEQVLVLVAAGALVSLAISSAKARLLLWQGLLLVLLLLPAIEPWKTPAAEVTVETTAVTFVNVTHPVAPQRFQWREEYWLWVIAAGAALRLLWVAAGFLRLRRYRMQANPLAQPPLPFTSEAARWYVSDSVPGPVTYGWRQPVILLPARIQDLPADLREAIQCHELIHVRRGDWPWVLVEAVLRSVLWFHPAIWFVLGRIQLTREQAVDQEAVALLENRERYLDALVAVAGYRLEPDLAPASLFLRKRHLAARVEAVMKEIKMSRPRIVAGVAAVCSALPLAVYAAVVLFPFVSAPEVSAQTSPDSLGITVDAGAPLLHRVQVRRPEGVAVNGTVVLQATLNTAGEVTDARVLSGPDELRKSALSSVLQWHYKAGPAQTQISIKFEEAVAVAVLRTGTAPQPTASQAPGITFTPGGRGGAAPAIATAPPPPPPPPPPPALFPATIATIRFYGVAPEAEQELRSRLTIHEGDVVNQSDMTNLNNSVRSFDSHLSAEFARAVNAVGNSSFNVAIRIRPEGLRADAGVGFAPPPPPPPPGAPGATAEGVVGGGPLKVGGAVQSQKLVKKVQPTYPAIAKQARIQGSVVLQATIGPDGAVQQLQMISATSPLLVQAAMDAVKQWVYQPTLLNGSPVAVQTEVTTVFSLSE